MVNYLYRNEAERLEVFRQIRENPSFVRAVALIERLVVLAPQDKGNWESLAGIYSMNDDLPALRKIHARSMETGFEHATALQSSLDFYSGKEDEKIKTQLGSALKASEADFTPELKAKNPRAWAMAASQWTQTSLASHLLGLEIDFAKVRSVAEEAYKLLPSAATGSTLKAVLCAQAAARLAQASPTFKAIQEKHSRLLKTQNLLAFAALSDRALLEQICADADVKRYLAMEQEVFNSYKTGKVVPEYFLIRHTDPAFAAKMLERSRTDECTRLEDEIGWRLSPHASSTLLDKFFSKMLEGDEAGAWKIFDDARALGLPMPEKK
jgi:hypothetical protein